MMQSAPSSYLFFGVKDLPLEHSCGFVVTGMTCDGCKNSIENIIKTCAEKKGLKEIKVSVQLTEAAGGPGKVNVTLNYVTQQLVHKNEAIEFSREIAGAISEAGLFEVTTIPPADPFDSRIDTVLRSLPFQGFKGGAIFDVKFDYDMKIFRVQVGNPSNEIVQNIAKTIGENLNVVVSNLTSHLKMIHFAIPELEEKDISLLRKTLEEKAYIADCQINYSTKRLTLTIPVEQSGQMTLKEQESELNKIKKNFEETLLIKLENGEINKEANKKTFVEYCYPTLVNGFYGVGLILFSNYIPAPTTLIGQIVGTVLGALTLGVMWVSGKNHYKNAWHDLKINRSANMYSLIALGTLSAWLYSMILVFLPEITMATGYQFSAVNMLLLTINIGHFLKKLVKNYADKKAKDLTQVYNDFQPSYAKRYKHKIPSELLLSKSPSSDLFNVPSDLNDLGFLFAAPSYDKLFPRNDSPILPSSGSRSGSLNLPSSDSRSGGLNLPSSDSRGGSLNLPSSDSRSGSLTSSGSVLGVNTIEADPLNNPLNWEDIPYKEIRKGDLIRVDAGCRVPVEGILLTESAYLRQEALTGEARPCFKKKGDVILSGSLTDRTIYLRPITHGYEGRLTKVIEDAANANQKKPVISKTLDEIAKYFAPGIIAIAIFSASFWLLRGYSFAWSVNIFISVLVCACPCAISLAVPLASFIGSYKLLNRGILIKRAAIVEKIVDVDTVVLDKTGTLTNPFIKEEKFKIESEKETILQYATSLEQHQILRDHPIAQAFSNKYDQNLLPCTLAQKGQRGISGIVDGKKVVIGPIVHLEDCGIKEESISGDLKKAINDYKKRRMTAICIAIDGVCRAAIGLEHAIRPEAKKMVEDLQKLGLEIFIFTGDNTESAEATANALGISLKKVLANLEENEKKVAVEFLQDPSSFQLEENATDQLAAKVRKRMEAEKRELPPKLYFLKELVPKEVHRRNRSVMLVGDGVNDLGALKYANVGVAAGSWVEAAAGAPIVIQNLKDVVSLIIMARTIKVNILYNLLISGLYNILSISMATGLLYPLLRVYSIPILASALMTIPSLLVLLNTSSLTYQIDYQLAQFEKPSSSRWDKILHSFPFQMLLPLLQMIKPITTLNPFEANKVNAVPNSPNKSPVKLEDYLPNIPSVEITIKGPGSSSSSSSFYLPSVKRRRKSRPYKSYTEGLERKRKENSSSESLTQKTEEKSNIGSNKMGGLSPKTHNMQLRPQTRYAKSISDSKAHWSSTEIPSDRENRIRRGNQILSK